MLRLHSGGADFPLLGEVLFRKFQFYLREQNFVEQMIGFFHELCSLGIQNWLLFYIYSVASMPSPSAW